MIEVEPPEGLSIPEGVVEGDTFEALATFKVMKNGKLYLTEIDGNDVSKKGHESEEPSNSYVAGAETRAREAMG